MSGADIAVRIVGWTTAQALVMPLRTQVFVVEQGVPPELELDEFDPLSQHAIATDAANVVIATGRLLPDGHIGRMAVARAARGQGLGAAVLNALMEEAQRRGFTRVVLSAQLHAMGFYQRRGFMPYGPVYMDAGIEHRAMAQTLDRIQRPREQPDQ